MAWARVLRRVRIEASMRFEPRVTTSPPSRSGSVLVVSLTVRPARAALGGGDGAEGADNGGELREAAVLRQHAEEVARQG